MPADIGTADGGAPHDTAGPSAGDRGKPLRLSHPADPAELRRIRGHVQDWAVRHDLPETAVIDLQLALGEAAANGIEHAYANLPRGTVDIEVRLRRERGETTVEVRVTDHGRWRPVPEVNDYRGRGLTVIEQLARRVEIAGTSRGTQVCFEIPL